MIDHAFQKVKLQNLLHLSHLVKPGQTWSLWGFRRWLKTCHRISLSVWRLKAPENSADSHREAANLLTEQPSSGLAAGTRQVRKCRLLREAVEPVSASLTLATTRFWSLRRDAARPREACSRVGRSPPGKGGPPPSSSRASVSRLHTGRPGSVAQTGNGCTEESRAGVGPRPGPAPRAPALRPRRAPHSPGSAPCGSRS